MINFFNKFKKPCFDVFLVHFPNLWGKKLRLCHAQLDIGFYNHAKNYKKLMIQLWKNRSKDKRMNRPYFIATFWLLPPSNKLVAKAKYQKGSAFAIQKLQEPAVNSS